MIPQSQNLHSFDRIGFYKEIYYKEIYYKELDRKGGLNNEITLQGTILVALLSGIFFLLTSFRSSFGYVITFFSAIILSEVVLILITGYYLFRSYYDFETKGRKYRYLSEMAEIEQYYKTCLQQANYIEFENYIADTLIDVTDSHIEKNDEKTLLLTKSAKWMAWAFRLAAAIIVVFLFNYTAEPYILKRQNPIVPKSSQQNGKRGQSRLTTPTPTTATATATAQSISSTSATSSSSGDNRARRQNTPHN